MPSRAGSTRSRTTRADAVPSESIARTVGSAGGALFAAAFGLLARVRGTRALHPVGVGGTGSLRVSPGLKSRVPLLDEAGPHPCRVRWSRATGLQRGPDVEGLAVRIEGAAAGDVLFASTGTGVVTRHVLTVRPAHRHGPLTTLLPMETGRGSLLLRLDPMTADENPPTAYALLIAAPGQPWHERGRLDIVWSHEDCRRRHDPVGRPPAGTWTHPLWARLRAPSYGSSQEVGADVHTASVRDER